jgi:hypothetical protein
MMLSRTRYVAAALLSFVFASACGSDSATSSLESPADGVSLTEALSQLSLPAVGATDIFRTGVPDAIPALDPSKCVYTASSQSFVCSTVKASNLTFSQSYTLLDASGNKQSAFSPTTTSAIHASTTMSGTFTDGAATFTLDGKQDLTLSGLLAANHSLDGSGTTKITGSGGAGVQLGTLVTTALDKVVLPAHATGAAAIPTSGTMSAKVAGLGAEGVLFDMKITFIGSGKATIAVSAGGLSQTCTVNLAVPGSACS